MKPVELLRAPTARERAIVEAVADATRTTSANALRSQASRMLVASNCGCGCESFTVSIPDAAPVVTMGDVPALVGDAPPIEVLPLFNNHGTLTSVEVTYFLTEPNGIPAATSLTAHWVR
ncbi:MULTISPECIES: hypothetical protein [Curtobacterium]|uniref:hypothetical protein n=1 Tax=Curtobacterium flaccumfaciens TaxID=2035 RepID=UPI003F608EF0